LVCALSTYIDHRGKRFEAEVLTGWMSFLLPNQQCQRLKALKHCYVVQESEIVRTWLCELRMEDCWELFDSAGYDMPTISRMTPEVDFQPF